MAASKFDLIVIGSGPAGEGAAMMAAKNHRKVGIVERHPSVGGGCTHWGTIPSKALRQAVKALHDLRHNPLMRGMQIDGPGFAELLHTSDKVVEQQVASRRRFYERNRVPIFQGQAKFAD